MNATATLKNTSIFSAPFFLVLCTLQKAHVGLVKLAHDALSCISTLSALSAEAPLNSGDETAEVDVSSIAA